MSLNQDVEVLKRIPLFANFEPAKLKLLAFASERMTFAAGQTVCAQGDAGDTAYVIISGEADVIVNTPDGPVTVAVLKDNAFVGEIAILIDIPRTATVQASTELITLEITKDLFFKMVTEFPSMAVEVMRELASRLERTTARLSATEIELEKLKAQSH
jgi:CRP-like cAMP-binding protein